MTLPVGLDELAHALGAELARRPRERLALPLDCPEWLGATASHPLRLAADNAPGTPPPAAWIATSPRSLPADDGVPALITQHPISDLRFRVNHFLDRHLPRLIPGTLMALAGGGVLIQGPAGCGKSRTAVELIDRGHRLVADDAVTLHASSQRGLAGHAPRASAGFLQLRGLGPIAVRDHYPDGVSGARELLLVVGLNSSNQGEPLRGGWSSIGLMGRRLPHIALHATAPPALLIELAAREITRNGAPLTGVQRLSDQQGSIRA